jgi:HNH endonuclease
VARRRRKRERLTSLVATNESLAWCICHHIVFWADGGTTCLENLVLLCERHHTVIHHGEWTARLGSDGLPEFIPPPWIDPQRRPRRNPYSRRPPDILDDLPRHAHTLAA